MESELTARALLCGRSLISNHPRLDRTLAECARELGAANSVVHVLLIRANQRTHGVCAIHWLGTPRPSFERRAGFYLFSENAALAVAIAEERAALRRLAYVDLLTGLPNQAGARGGARASGRHNAYGVLVLDFDGVARRQRRICERLRPWRGRAHRRGRPAPSSGSPRPASSRPACTPAGTSSASCFPGSDDATTQARGRALEAMLDDLDVPESHRQVYRGASVGAAARQPRRDACGDRRPGIGRDARAQTRRPRYSSVEMKTLLSSVLWASASMPSSLPTPDCL